MTNGKPSLQIIVLILVIFLIPSVMLSVIYLTTDAGDHGSFFDSGIFKAILLTLAAVLPLLLYFPFFKVSQRIVPAKNEDGYSKIIARKRIISFILAVIGIGSITMVLFILDSIYNEDFANPLTEILLPILGVIIAGHILAYGIEIVGYKTRSLYKTKSNAVVTEKQ